MTLALRPCRAFCTVTLKLTLPGLLSGIILTFIPSMGLFFIADILGGNKVVLVGSLIQDQLMKAHNQPFAAALSRCANGAYHADDKRCTSVSPTPANWRACYEKPYKTAQYLSWCHPVPYLPAYRAGGRVFIQREQDLQRVGRLFPALV